jgi:hypothetical protein
MVKRALLIICVLSLIGCASDFGKKTPEMVQHIKGSIFKATERGYYTAELVMKPKQPVVGKNKGSLIIHDYEANDTPGLKIEIIPRMTGSEVTSQEKPVIKDAGRGLYLIENIDLHSPGMWELWMRISETRMSDVVTLPLPEIK